MAQVNRFIMVSGAKDIGTAREGRATERREHTPPGEVHATGWPAHKTVTGFVEGAGLPPQRAGRAGATPRRVPGPQPWPLSMHRGRGTPHHREAGEPQRPPPSQDRKRPGLRGALRRPALAPQAGEGEHLTATPTEQGPGACAAPFRPHSGLPFRPAGFIWHPLPGVGRAAGPSRRCRAGSARGGPSAGSARPTRRTSTASRRPCP